MSELSEKQVMEAYRDPAWRLQNLYRIVTKDDGVATFSPNRAQRRVLNDLHNRNVILKARQLGFCLDPSTRVLTADLRWVRIDHLTIGDELVACDENIPGGRGADRKMRTATVEGMSLTERESYRITFDDGRQVVCSGDHRWLSKNVATQAKWRAINCQNGTRKKLRVGHKVRWITKPWGDGDIEDGWFGGMLDGEGSIAKDNTQASVNVSQREGGVWDRLVAYSRERGYNARIENDSAGRSNKYGREPVPKLVFGRLDEIFRLVGQTRPTRFIGNRFWEGRSMPGKKSGVGWATITSIEKVGARKLVDIQTSTGTFIAEGFVSHNSTLVAILWLDTALFSDNPITCAVIAQDRDTAGKLFEKITFAYDGLPKVLRDMFPLERRTTEEIAFEHNKSSIRVATSARGGTIHRLHVSEMGKIGAANPKKAKEIVTGSIPAVPEAGIVVVESTAEGRSGRYYDLVQGAKAAKDSGRPLAPQDYKLHFFAWWEDPGYTADPSQVALSDSDKSYFLEVEGIIGRSLLPEQKAWYAATLRGTFAGDRPLMWQEYPSHCVTGDTLVSTPSNGMVRIRDLEPDGVEITRHMAQGVKPVFNVTTKLGYELTCTSDHRIKTVDGSFQTIDDGLRVGSRVQMAQPRLGREIQSVQWAPVPFATARIEIDADFAEFVGVFMGDGSFYNGTVSVACDAHDEDMVLAVESMFERYLGGSASRATGSKRGCIEVRKCSAGFIEPFLAMGIIERRKNGGFKRRVHVPDFIFASPAPVAAGFLRGLFEADGFAARDGQSIKLFSRHESVCRDVQRLLLAFGIESRVTIQKKRSRGRIYVGRELALRVAGVRKFAQQIGFISKRKQDRANLAVAREPTKRWTVFDWTDEIASIVPAGEQETYDITTVSHEFVANGIVIHNCDEPFKVSLDGAYYAAQIADARKQGRIGVVPLESGVPVNTFWDLGLNDNTAIWCHQRVGLQNRFVRFYKNSGEPLAHYAQWLLELGVVFGTHYLPHDAGAQRYGINPDNNDSVEDMLRKLLPGHRFEIVPRVTRVLSGIHATRQALSSCWFDETGCSEGVADLEAYRKAWDESRGTWKDQPHHGPESDGADAFRMFGQVAQSGGRFATSVAPPRGGRRGAVTRRGGPMAV